MQQLENQIIGELKQLAENILSVNSYEDLALQDQAVSQLFEKYIFLKQLHKTIKKPKPIAKTEPALQPEAIKNPEPLTVSHPNEPTPIKENELMKVEEKIPPKDKKSNFFPIHLDFNDSIAFKKILFNDNISNLEIFFDKLNSIQDLSNSLDFIQIQFLEFTQPEQKECINRLSELVNNRFS